MAVGETLTEPLTGWLPTPLSMVRVVVLVVVQLSVEESPGAMVDGVAVKLVMSGASAPTVTVAVAVLVPPGPVAVIV